jgi:hypothetical protein
LTSVDSFTKTAAKSPTAKSSAEDAAEKVSET